MNATRLAKRLPVGALALLASAVWTAASSAQDSTGPVLPQISEFVREVFQDADGDMWFGTNGEGVCRYDGSSLEFFSIAEGFGGVAVRGIAQHDDGSMWFATNTGVCRLRDDVFTTFTSEHGLSAESVWSLMIDRTGTVWAGTHEGLCRFDGERFSTFELPRVEVEEPESRFSPLVVFAMWEAPSGDLWFGTDGEGAHRYDGASITSYSAKDGLCGNLVRCIRGDRDGRVWIGSDGGGVSVWDGASFRTFTSEDGLCNDRIFEVYQDRTGTIWLSTLGAGACRYDGTSFSPFGAAQGLTVNDLPCACGSGKIARHCHGTGGGHVQEFYEDRDGIMWFGCSGGLFRMEGDACINVTRKGPWPDRDVGDG